MAFSQLLSIWGVIGVVSSSRRYNTLYRLLFVLAQVEKLILTRAYNAALQCGHFHIRMIGYINDAEPTTSEMTNRLISLGDGAIQDADVEISMKKIVCQHVEAIAKCNGGARMRATTGQKIQNEKVGQGSSNIM